MACRDVSYPISLSLENVQTLILLELKSLRNCLGAALKKSRVQLSDSQYGALISWAYNRRYNVLVKRLNTGESSSKVAEEELV
ncbi:hypothetical protein KI688_004497 [Linnemannia hyalina]|uniref:Uncharacterized protein n=1 Tax=Linnemannia hyalina TaxID=64524 RepID=A0A9P8BS67_9FUNG|nr:hypothetical protein KI688_004497 [Linnemannia hyalina]